MSKMADSDTLARMAGYERLVTSEPVSFAACGSTMTPGTLLLTDHRVVLDAGGGHHVEVPVGAIRRISLSLLRNRLRLDVGEDCVIIAGERVARVHGALSALLTGVGPGDERGAGPEELLDAFDSLLMRGPLAHPGELVVTTRRLHFRAHSRLDELVGARPFDLALENVRRVGAIGWPEKRLTLSTNDGDHVFAVEQPAEHVRRLVPLLLRPETFGLGCLPFGELPLASDAEPFVAPWREVVGWALGERIEHGAPAARWTEELVADRGWLVVTSERAMFLPLGGPTADARPFVAPLHGVGTFTPSDPSHIALSYDGADVTLHPLGGARTIRRLLPLLALSPAAREVPEEDGALSQVLGDATSLRLSMGEVELLSRAGERVVDLGHALGVVLGVMPDATFEAGAEVAVEVGRTEGVYRFMAQVLGVRRSIGEGSGLILELSYPDEVGFSNRRGHFRAPAQARAAMRRLVFAEGRGYEALPGEQAVGVADLSDGGCRLLSDEELTVGDEVRLTLDLCGTPVDVDARIVRQQGPDAQDGWLCGVRFFNVGESVHDRIHREVFRLQRELLVRRADTRGDRPRASA
ncbi:MAG: hypothetical protein AMXMBFR64_54490 [Myxococcales bacterium]